MDPKATLEFIKDAIADKDWASAREGFQDYWSWRRKGGFQPPGGDKKAHALEEQLNRYRAPWDPRERVAPWDPEERERILERLRTLKGSYKSSTAANRRSYSHISSGSPVTRSVPRACALVQSGGKKGKIRKGCRMTKNGARCDVLTRLPREARARIGKKFKLINCPS